MNTQALDALVALAAASAVPPAPAPAARAAAATNAPSAAEVADARALLAAHRRAQQRQAQVQAQRHALAREQALAHRRQHRQEQAHRAALANLPPDVLHAYFAAAASPTSARDALSGPLPPPPLSLGHMPSVPNAAALDAVPSLDLRAGPFLLAPLPSPQGPLKAARSLALGPAFGAANAPTDVASGTAKASGGKRPAPRKMTAARAVPPKKRLARARAMSEGGCGDARKKEGLHESVMSEWEDKKEAKRAANRLSAHLSRKRKKLFLEDLKGENQELRRKETILQSIPDLIVVFDSSGRMPFVSHSVSRFLDYAADELEDSSFWDRLTPGGVRLVKSAFIDALAKKRSEDEDSTPLWDGESRNVRLVDRNGEEAATAVSLKGVVHFAGESPECVCSIRPLEDPAGAASDDDEAALGDAAEGNAADPSFNRISDVDSDESKSVPSSRTM